ncbi:MAG: hypothetical protein EPO08_00780 [Rhodospirillaceae bacterium]|nr:MAG: hypothetical protein EPO08_00780 [Rhodospirillaceae bacterium]
MFRKSLTIAALMAGTALFLPQAANAAPGYVVGATEMHAGPDYDYPTIRIIHDGRGVYINGCLDDWSWCDVSFHEDRGWVAGENLVADYDGGREGIIDIAPMLGIGILAFSFDAYWDRYYRGRPFYSDRGRWESYSFEHHRDNWGPRPERPHGHDDGRFHDDNGRGRPADQSREQVQQNRRQAPSSQSWAEHQDNRRAGPERQAAPAHEERGPSPRPEQQQHEQHQEHHGHDGDDNHRDH